MLYNVPLWCSGGSASNPIAHHHPAMRCHATQVARPAGINEIMIIFRIGEDEGVKNVIKLMAKYDEDDGISHLYSCWLEHPCVSNGSTSLAPAFSTLLRCKCIRRTAEASFVRSQIAMLARGRVHFSHGN